MKFYKQLQWQVLPEWRDHYCDYKMLKGELRKIKEQRCHDRPSRHWWMPQGLLLVLFSWRRRKIDIVVHSRGHALFETEADDSASEDEKAFFRMLDSQLGIVNDFYIAKEGEVESVARSLLFQLESNHRPSIEGAGNLAFLRKAEADLCRKLCVLRKYSTLNRMAFWKITKKFDKITGHKVAPVYLRAVEASYFRTSHKLLDTTEQVNAVYRRYSNKERFCPSSSFQKNFYFGLVTGSCVGLLAALLLLHILSRRKWGTDVMTSFTVFGTVALFVLHVSVYACNVYLWQGSRIHYTSMFELAPAADLTHHDIFFFSLLFGTILLLAMAICLAADILSIQHLVVDVPVYLLVAIVALLVIPHRFLHKTARYGFLRLNLRTLLSPLSDVEFADFFFADQLTSQAVALKGLGFWTCNHGSRFIGGATAVCYSATYQHVILLLPQWWRFLQCLRKWRDGDPIQLANAGKYLCGMLSILAKLAYTKTNATLWFVLLTVISVCSTTYQLLWDLVMDWGLLQRRSRNPWLREELLLANKSVYVYSMMINVALRCAWAHTLLPLKTGLHQMVVEFIFACLEVVRRGIWNFFRLENEHSRSTSHIKPQIP